MTKTNNIHRSLLLLAITTCAAISLDAASDSSQRPSITVGQFAAVGGTQMNPAELGALADDLAQELVDGGRFRVLPRQWLPVERQETGEPTTDRLRQAAAAARVDYIVAGKISRSRQVIPAVRSPSVRREPAGFPMGLPRPMQNRLPVDVRGVITPSRPQTIELVTLTVDVIDTATGRVVDQVEELRNKTIRKAVETLAQRLAASAKLVGNSGEDR